MCIRVSGSDFLPFCVRKKFNLEVIAIFHCKIPHVSKKILLIGILFLNSHSKRKYITEIENSKERCRILCHRILQNTLRGMIDIEDRLS
jgi:hypothetical protein